MRLLLERHVYEEHYTIGSLFLDGVKLCWTLEDRVREREGVPVEEWKIPAETAIPSGTYKVVISRSNRFKRELPLLLNVPGFEGIRIHPGNTGHNTEGCILVGQTWEEEDFIGHSRAAFEPLFARIKTAFDAGEDIFIEVS